LSEPAKTAFDMARTLLNDDGVQLWTDAVLRTKLQTAHRELQIQLRANACPITRKTVVVQVGVRDTSIPNPTDIIEPIALWERGLNEFDSQFQRMTESDPREVSAIFKVPAGTKDLTVLPAYPDDLVQPIWLKERAPGQTDRDFIDMAEVDFLPQVLVDRRLIYWCWTGQKIMTISSYADREVMIRYKKALKIPQEATDNVGPFFGEIYLSYKTAALAVGSITPRDENKLEFLTLQADSSLEDLLKLAAMSAQNLPTKRRPYHRGRGRGRVIRAI